MCSLPMSLLWSECNIFKSKIKVYFSFNHGEGKKDQLKNKYKTRELKNDGEKNDQPEELRRKDSRSIEEEQEKEKKVIIVPFSDMKLRYVNSFISSKKCSQHLERIMESEAKCCEGVLMDTSGWQGRRSTFSISVLQPATHFLSVSRSHGSDLWQLGRDFKNHFVVLLPPSHKHTFACIAEAATIIFRRSSLLGRARWARRARVAFVCCSPARKHIQIFVSGHVLICQLENVRKSSPTLRTVHLYVCLFVCLLRWCNHLNAARQVWTITNEKMMKNFPDEREKGKVGWILDGILERAIMTLRSCVCEIRIQTAWSPPSSDQQWWRIIWASACWH